MLFPRAARSVAAEVGTFELRVYDLRGRRILERMVQAPVPASYSVTWDGRDSAGRRTPAGIYFLTLEGRGLRETRKLVRLQ